MFFYSIFIKIVTNTKDQAAGHLLTNSNRSGYCATQNTMLTVDFPKLLCWPDMDDGAYYLIQITNLRIKINPQTNPLMIKDFQNNEFWLQYPNK